MDAKYEALFTPWKIGNVEIKNRIVMCPMGGTSLFGWFELGCFLVEAAAGELKPAEQRGAAHGTHDDAVLDLHIADLPGGKQGFVFGVHIDLPLLCL